MKFGRAHSSSTYMEFAKLHSTAKFNLATSGLSNYSLRHLPVRIEDLEINGPTLYGYAPLQERLARLNDVEPDCVVHAAGTSMANHLAMAGLFQPGEEVLIEEPTYELLLRTALFLGARVKRFQRRLEENYQLDPAEVARSITPATRLIVLTNMHNPSSVLTDQRTLKQVGEIARENGARVLVDEVYLQALYESRPPSSFKLGEQFVVTSSLTKAYGLSGLRCGWILASPPLAHHIWRTNDLFAASSVHVAELLSIIALDHLDQIARRAEELLETNRRVLRDLWNKFANLEGAFPEVGTTAFPRLTRGTAENFCRFLRDEFETSVVPGRFFERPEHFRIGLGGDAGMTREGLERLAFALEQWDRQ
jgi:aspartate/methionine/tyrosine aminotransferase